MDGSISVEIGNKKRAFHKAQFSVAYNLCNPMFGEAFPSFRICSLIVNSFALVEVICNHLVTDNKDL